MRISSYLLPQRTTYFLTVP